MLVKAFDIVTCSEKRHACTNGPLCRITHAESATLPHQLACMNWHVMVFHMLQYSLLNAVCCQPSAHLASAFMHIAQLLWTEQTQTSLISLYNSSATSQGSARLDISVTRMYIHQVPNDYHEKVRA